MTRTSNSQEIFINETDYSTSMREFVAFNKNRQNNSYFDLYWLRALKTEKEDQSIVSEDSTDQHLLKKSEE